MIIAPTRKIHPVLSYDINTIAQSSCMSSCVEFLSLLANFTKLSRSHASIHRIEYDEADIKVMITTYINFLYVTENRDITTLEGC